MKQKTLLREIVVIVAVASVLGLAYNFIASPKKLALIREEQVLQQASDSLLFGPSPTTSQLETPATTGSSPQIIANQPLTVIKTAVSDTMKSAKQLTTQTPKSPTLQPYSTTPITKPAEKVKPAAISYQQVLRLLEDKDVLFIDSRNDDEWAEGHIPGAIHIFADEFQKHVPEVIGLPRDKRIVVYCSGGPECTLSHEVCEGLAAFGFTRLFIYFGGWTEWKKMKAEGK